VANTFILMGMKRRLKGTYMQLSRILGFYDKDGYEKWENYLEDFFRYFSLTPAQKCHYAQIKLAREVYMWWEDSHVDCHDWLILQELLHTQYAPHLEGLQLSIWSLNARRPSLAW